MKITKGKCPKCKQEVRITIYDSGVKELQDREFHEKPYPHYIIVKHKCK